MNCAACGRSISSGAVFVNGSYYCSNSCANHFKTYNDSKGKFGIGTGLSQMANGLFGGGGSMNVDNIVVGGGKVAIGVGVLALKGAFGITKTLVNAGVKAGKQIAKNAEAAKQQQAVVVAQNVQIAQQQQAQQAANVENIRIAQQQNRAQFVAQTHQPKAAEFIFCGDCGAKNQGGDMFCSDCGSKLE